MSTDLSTPRTLYLLDDNDDFRATAKWWLSGAGYDVIDFGDAQAAIDALAAADEADRLPRFLDTEETAT